MRTTATTRSTRSTRTAARALGVVATTAAATVVATALSAGSASAALLPGPLPVSAAATASTSATGAVGAAADVVLHPLRSTAGTVRLCPGRTTGLGITASAGSLTVVRPRSAAVAAATGAVGQAGVTAPTVPGTLGQVLDTTASVAAGPSGSQVSVATPVVDHVVGSTRVRLPQLQLQAVLDAVRADLRTAVDLVPTVSAAVDARARGAVVRTAGPLSLALDAQASECVDLDWQLLG